MAQFTHTALPTQVHRNCLKTVVVTRLSKLVFTVSRLTPDVMLTRNLHRDFSFSYGKTNCFPCPRLKAFLATQVMVVPDTLWMFSRQPVKRGHWVSRYILRKHGRLHLKDIAAPDSTSSTNVTRIVPNKQILSHKRVGHHIQHNNFHYVHHKVW